MKSAWLSILSLMLRCSQGSTTERPIIGILTVELPSNMAQSYPAYTSYITASYVKMAESSGARVVPIISGRNQLYYEDLLDSINGVIFPGGSASDKVGHLYYDAARIIYKIAKKINDRGSTFPILGVCLGFQTLVTVGNEDHSILKQCDVHYEDCALEFLRPMKQTRLFSRLLTTQYRALKDHNVTFNWHSYEDELLNSCKIIKRGTFTDSRYCVFVDDFKQQSSLEDWAITTTSVSNKGIEFIASIEHEEYPFFGIQFHPEKGAFEWLSTSYLCPENALLTNRYFFDMLVYYAEMNDHKFDKENEYHSLIYSSPVVDSRAAGEYMQIYLF